MTDTTTASSSEPGKYNRITHPRTWSSISTPWRPQSQREAVTRDLTIPHSHPLRPSKPPKSLIWTKGWNIIIQPQIGCTSGFSRQSHAVRPFGTKGPAWPTGTHAWLHPHMTQPNLCAHVWVNPSSMSPVWHSHVNPLCTCAGRPLKAGRAIFRSLSAPPSPGLCTFPSNN